MRAGAAVFLDRDGTLISEVGYLHRREQLHILPGVPAALRNLRECGFKLIVVTNQSAVARGLLSESDLADIHDLLREKLAAEGAFLDAIYYCPHHPSEGRGNYRITCSCRKPRTGMVDRAAADLGIDPRVSYVIGDQDVDLKLAAQVGATGILLDDGSPSHILGGATIADNLGQAAQWIVAQETRLKKC
jgi:D-glycero-D-manno-heptose 1,7-bisphosphate phosphatase